MASKIKLKKSSVPGKVPLVSDLDYGEIAINYADGKLYYKSADNIIKSFSVSEFTQHGALAGLLNDDHPQYVHIVNDRTISASHTFAPVTTRAPFVLGPNAQGQLVSGFNADLLDGRDSSYFYSPDNTPLQTVRYTFEESLRWNVVHNKGTTKFSDILTDDQGVRFFAKIQIVDENSFYVDLTTAVSGTADITFYF